MTNIGEKIRIMRKRCNLSQAKLAEKAGMSTSAIAMYESNKRTPKYGQLEALAEVFNVPLSAFLDENPIQDTPAMPNPVEPPKKTEVAKLISFGIDHLSEDEQARAMTILRAAFPAFAKQVDYLVSVLGLE